MFPLVLDLTRIPVLLAGSGPLLLRRLAQLDSAGAARVEVFCPDANDSIRYASGKRLVERLPSASDMRDYTIIMAAGLERRDAEVIATAARALGKLVNVEDVNELCDFYFTANVRRGDLLIAVSTGGASPTLARKVRDTISLLFGDEWEQRTQEIKQARLNWKSAGAGMKEVLANTERFFEERGWFRGNKGNAA